MKHNKKRNIGIIYELFLRYMSKCIIENDKKKLKIATNIISENFCHKKEIYKEFRVFNALNNANLNTKESAIDLLRDSKKLISEINESRLSKEKSSLIKKINYRINDNNFYYSRITNYKDLGTIQMLINEWKKKNKSNIINEKQLEEKVVSIIINKDLNVNKTEKLFESKKSLETSNLVINSMTEKINKKYKNMSSIQKEIIKNYGLYNQDAQKLSTFLSEIKSYSLEKLSIFEISNQNDYISGKIKEVKEKILNINESDCSDSTIVKFLTLTELVDELNNQ